MKRGTGWLSALLVGAVLAIASGSLGALHRYTEHPSANGHSCHDTHQHGGDGHHHDESPNPHPHPHPDHEDCDLCLIIMVGGQWAMAHAEPGLVSQAPAFQIEFLNDLVCDLGIFSEVQARAPPVSRA